MVETLITIRRAKLSDAQDIAEVHDAAWREAYRGIIPGSELEKMIQRRGPRWWQSAIERGSRLCVLDFDETVGGYVSYGRNRLPHMQQGGEIFELYLAPEFQGLGFGRKLFEAARHDLRQNGLKSFVVWALSDNARAVEFYQHLGGKFIHRADERFGKDLLPRSAYAFGE